MYPVRLIFEPATDYIGGARKARLGWPVFCQLESIWAQREQTAFVDRRCIRLSCKTQRMKAHDEGARVGMQDPTWYNTPEQCHFAARRSLLHVDRTAGRCVSSAPERMRRSGLNQGELLEPR